MVDTCDVGTININEHSLMAKAANLWVCKLCNFIVEPTPVECPNCSTLFCRCCVNMRRNWACPTCSSKSEP